MNIERKTPEKGIWFIPLLLAIPFLAAMIFASLRFGPLIMKLLSAAVKTAVVQ